MNASLWSGRNLTLVLGIGVFVLATPLVAAERSWRIEAESADVGKNAAVKVVDDAEASGGKAIEVPPEGVPAWNVVWLSLPAAATPGRYKVAAHLKATNLAEIGKAWRFDVREDSRLLAYAVSYGYWCQNAFFIGGHYEATQDVFYRPSARGVKASFQGSPADDDFVRDPTAGWSAAVDTVLGDGLVFLVNYHDIDMLYDCSGNATLEWMCDKIPVPAGRAWETDILLVPITGRVAVAHASTNFLAAVNVTRHGTAVTVTHHLRATQDPVADLALNVRIVSALDRKEVVLPPLAVGGLSTVWKSVASAGWGC